MTHRSIEQFEAIRKEYKKLIIESAIELFANEGYYNSSISKIAKKAKISKGLIYNYFESKEALLIEIIDSGFNEMYDLFDTNKDGILEKHEMKEFIEKTFQLLVDNKSFWQLYFRVSLQPDVFPIVEEKIKSIMEPTMKMLVDYFTKRGADDPVAEALLFGAMLDGISMDYVFSPSLVPLNKIINAIIKKYC